MITVIQHTPNSGRDSFAKELSLLFMPSIIVLCKGNPFDTFLRCLKEIAEGGGGILIEDDAETTEEKVTEIYKYCNGEYITSFFKRDKRERGVFALAASSFLFNVCLHIPKKYAESMIEYSKTWKRRVKHPTGFDLLIRDYLVENNKKYYAVYPSLVQHRIGRSLLGSRKSNRTSPTYE